MGLFGNKKKRPEASDTAERQTSWGKKAEKRDAGRAGRAGRALKGFRGARNSRKGRS